jgi:hypothetical protein
VLRRPPRAPSRRPQGLCSFSPWTAAVFR